jgi:hypothetical protein
MSPRKSQARIEFEERLQEPIPDAELDARLQSEFDMAIAGYCRALVERQDQQEVIRTARVLSIVGYAKTYRDKQDAQGAQEGSPWTSWTDTVRKGLRDYAEQHPEDDATIMNSNFFRLEGRDRKFVLRRSAEEVLDWSPGNRQKAVQAIALGVLRLKQTRA